MKLVKRLLIAIAVLVVLVIAAAIIVPFFIPTDTYTSKLIAAVKSSTGRDLRIDGKVSLTLFPTFGLEANQVSFANPPGAASKDMATLGKLQVALQVLPLLHKEIEIKRLVLVDPVIDLEVDKQGRPNWQFSQAPAQPAPAKQPEKPAPAGGGGTSLSDVHLDDVRLVNGKIIYLDQRSGAKQELSEIGMTVSLPSLDGPLSANGAATYRNERMTLAASLAKPREFMDGKVSAAALKLSAKPISFDFKGEGAGSTPLKLDGAVDLQVPSVRGLAAWAGQPLKLPGTGFGPLGISGKVSMAGSKIAFSDAKLKLDDMNAKGALALDSGGARPALKGQLDVDKLDANPYLPPEKEAKKEAPAAGKGGAGGPAAKSDWSDDPIDLTALKSADVDFSLSAGGLQYRKIQVGKSALALKLVNGRFEADLTELALYKGAGKGKVVLDGSGAVPAIEADFNLSGVQIQPLLHDAADLDRVSGTGGFTTEIAGHGKSQREIIAALNGKGDLKLANGVIKGLNLVGMVKNVAASFQGAQSGADQTDFQNLTGTYTITNGILRNTDLQLKSAEVPMTGAGTVDLPHRSVDYKITPKIAGAVAVPVVIKGPWDNLSYRPDVAGIVGDKLLKEGTKGLDKGLDNALKGKPKVEDVLKGLLGGQKK
jgi:AsmA protein